MFSRPKPTSATNARIVLYLPAVFIRTPRFRIPSRSIWNSINGDSRANGPIAPRSPASILHRERSSIGSTRATYILSWGPRPMGSPCASGFVSTVKRRERITEWTPARKETERSRSSVCTNLFVRKIHRTTTLSRSSFSIPEPRHSRLHLAERRRIGPPLEFDCDRLHFGVLLQAVLAQFASDTGLLEPAERSPGVENVAFRARAGWFAYR